MFRSAANPVLRLVFAPTFLLFYLIHQGEFLPFLAPMFVVIFLTIMPSKPPLYMLLKLLAVVVVISIGVALFGGVFMDSPVGIVLFCWLGIFWSFYRSHNNPKDMLGTYLLLFVIIIFIVNRQFNISVSIMPWLTLKTFLIAILATHVIFMLFPGDEQDIKADEKAMSGAKTRLGLIAFKATILMIVMYLLTSTKSSQSLLIAITLGSMIKIPISRDQRIFRNNRLIATLVGIFATLPIMVAQYFLVVSEWMLIGLSFFMGLQMARFAIRRESTLSVYQLMFTNFIVLLNQIVTYHGNQPFSVEMTRLASISIAILFGTIILNLIQHSSTPHSGSR
ncbi:DUF2955 domain-containing protein [Vibrio hangzhouensis]|uniref:DUF2955 domain-containing protein n=1 Tax=Vibrio hangzhouensis TaxID=462991 RepID=UPI001C98D9B3|nr:DUF2955 domain-containing protein [Vibrio hangzhouensis]MBY6196387.1 DUF2955 domain-containing protein [Vibrio hangzhouensis]